MDMEEKEDELIGFWENEDDGSGLHTIWGFALEFFAGGEGISHHWGRDVKPDEREVKISWKRTGEKTVSLKFLDDDWETIGYELKEFTGAYGTDWIKLNEKGKEEFWISYEPLYKKKEK